MLSRFQLANAIRALSMDAVENAKSGHPGAPMGMADIAEVLWRDFLRHNPNNPNWVNRDRFVLSNGHGSMLLYALLHLTGYALTIDDLKNFRQLHSKTPGHPEYGYTPGVETTTGPLGQGLANAVGFAIAEKVLAAQFNKPGHHIIDHYTYVFAGDGCLMEGISHEACSLAGTLGLGKLIVFYDDNGISIDGDVEGWFTEDVRRRFTSYGWQVIGPIDGHDPEAIHAAIVQAREETDRPTLIQCKTVIGFGAPNKEGTERCHGAPLGAEEIAAARNRLDWPYPPFEIPEEIYAAWDAREKGRQLEEDWQAQYLAYHEAYPEAAEALNRRLAGELPKEFVNKLNQWIRSLSESTEAMATRKASQKVLSYLVPELPSLIGGSADLTGSNLTMTPDSRPITKEDATGNYIFYGVREFAMSAIMNGLALHGGFIPYGGTFLMFMEYARNAVRMAALMKQRTIFVYTHDSIGLGEDGPTHQPVEQLTSLRTTPNLETWRPADLVETAVAWAEAIKRRQGPTALVLSRQSLPALERSPEQVAQVERGGYILRDSADTPQLIILATGSEVQLALSAADTLAQEGVSVRVVAMPCCERFDAQPQDYREQVLPPKVRARVAIEAAHPDYWRRYVGLDGAVVGVARFGESAPAADLFEAFGLTASHLVSVCRDVLTESNPS
ncbi:MAG: transketolase [Gammaproteobacteria bacterium]|nr:MAG: transketolase [Gammaproteobacteria bacterium]